MFGFGHERKSLNRRHLFDVTVRGVGGNYVCCATTCLLCCQVTHVFVEGDMVKEVRGLQGHGVLCLKPKYLGEYLLQVRTSAADAAPAAELFTEKRPPEVTSLHIAFVSGIVHHAGDAGVGLSCQLRWQHTRRDRTSSTRWCSCVAAENFFLWVSLGFCRTRPRTHVTSQCRTLHEGQKGIRLEPVNQRRATPNRQRASPNQR